MTRLQELVEQATHKVLGVRQLDSIILAELIVKECTNVVESGRFLHEDAPTAQFARECSAAIKRHFGFE